MNFRPVIFGGFVNGYSIARTFYETYGIKSLICDYSRKFSSLSSFVDYFYTYDPKQAETAFVEEISELGKRLSDQKVLPLLIVTNNEWLLPLCRNKEKLEMNFSYSFPNWSIVGRLTVKTKLYKLCEELNIAYPQTCTCAAGDPLCKIAALSCPVLVKLSSVVSYVTRFPKELRNNIFPTIKEAKRFIVEKFNCGYQGEFIVQEYIPGGVENLYTITTYSAFSGQLKDVSTGHKLAQYPEAAGTITAGLISYEPRIIEPAKRILEAVRYFGIINIEFKWDSRDSSYKLIKVNPRPGMWNYSAYMSGINLFELMVRDLILKEDIKYREGKEAIVWLLERPNKLLTKLAGKPSCEVVKRLISEGKFVGPRLTENENIIYNLNLKINDYLKKY